MKIATYVKRVCLPAFQRSIVPAIILSVNQENHLRPKKCQNVFSVCKLALFSHVHLNTST